jgi:hypothetical protein
MFSLEVCFPLYGLIPEAEDGTILIPAPLTSHPDIFPIRFDIFPYVLSTANILLATTALPTGGQT